MDRHTVEEADHMAENTPEAPQQTLPLSKARIALMGALCAVIIGAVILLGDRQPAVESPALLQKPSSTPAEPPSPAPTDTDNAAAVQAPITAPPILTEPAESPLPELEESDNALRDAMEGIPLGPIGQEYLIPTSVIERSASLIYLGAQGDVPYKLIPVARPKVAFPTVDDGRGLVADPSGFARYDALAKWVESVDLPTLIGAIARFLPLFREAWSYYGEESEDFDPAVLEMLDVITSTPSIDLSAARLVKKEAVWIYEDPAIEGLAPLQKQILRMGPENAEIVKLKASEAQALWLQMSAPKP
ncbi:MAG: DUF3014 domain-containing protein [Luminiphilus sp.]|nr:DUF3014 domain-containing protein [Luminiphilus sp.]